MLSSRETHPREGGREARERIAALERDLAHAKKELQICREACAQTDVLGDGGNLEEAHGTERQLQESMWYVSSGDCVLQDRCLSSPNYPDEYSSGSTCHITVTPAWRGYLWVEYFKLRSSTTCWHISSVARCYEYDALFIDGVPHDTSIRRPLLDGSGESSSAGTPDRKHQASSVHGSVPHRSIVWSADSRDFSTDDYLSPYGWKICQEEAPLPPWTLAAVGDIPCLMDRAGCLIFNLFPWGESMQASGGTSSVSIPDDWEGTVDVVQKDFPPYDSQEERYSNYRPNFHFYFSVRVQEEVFWGQRLLQAARKGLHGLEARGTMSFDWDYGNFRNYEICPGPPVNLSGPWGATPWTCDILGEPCQTACTQQFSDPDDVDGDGDVHDGHPHCDSAVGQAYCGPCRCGAGEAQTYEIATLYEHTPRLPLVTCRPCTPGKYKSHGNDTDDCTLCDLGSSSAAGATACTSCDRGQFSNEETAMCVPCQEGFFGGAAAQSACHECEEGHYAAKEGLTACEVCSVGYKFISKYVACEPCSPGTFGTEARTCVPCDQGRFQMLPGMSECTVCSDTLDTSGENPHLWTTMQADFQGWKEVSGASNIRQCGCVPHAWVDRAGTCRACGEGVQCGGMGSVVVLPGYFASVDSPGFVWRCHGADWRRCPGGVPGACAEGRNNESIACGECEPFTRMTYDGPCKKCEGPDTSLLIGAIVVALFLLGCVYFVLAHENRAKQRDVVTLTTIVGSQFLTTFQMVGALNSLAVLWPEPFATIVELSSLMNFRLEVLNLGCLVTTTPLHNYVATVFSFALLIACVVIYHFLYVLVFHRGLFRQTMPTLLCTVGTIFMTVFISISTSVFEPFHCNTHPNGESTMRAYGQVVCWNTDFGDDHQRMVVVGAIASLVPFCFFSVCVWATITLPRKLYERDSSFLKCFSFLFFRFRPGAHAFVLVLLLRNLAFALLPVITGDATDILALGLRSSAVCHGQLSRVPMGGVPSEPSGCQRALGRAACPLSCGLAI